MPWHLLGVQNTCNSHQLDILWKLKSDPAVNKGISQEGYLHSIWTNVSELCSTLILFFFFLSKRLLSAITTPLACYVPSTAQKKIKNNAYCKTVKLQNMHYGLKYQQSKQVFGNSFYWVSLSVCGEDLFPIASFPPTSPKSQISLFLCLVT